MKHLPEQTFKVKQLLFYTLIACTLVLSSGCKKEPEAPVLKVTTLATGLKAPIGLETDKNGNVWVGEGGTGQNDGKVVVITPDGKKYDAIINFESVIFEGNEVDGPTHLLFYDGLLFILGTKGKMYKANVSGYKPGDAPQSASSLAVEDIGTFVRNYKFINDVEDSHPYNLIPGPDGNLYIADAGANAIIRRGGSGALSVLAEVPGIPNPTPIGPPVVESVPTGIIFDGQHFLVTTLLGFPFPPGKSLIYKISLSGAVSVFQQGFTSGVDIAKGGSRGKLVLEHGVFGAMGFARNTGRLVWANGTTSPVLAEGFNLPAGLKQANEHTWYVSSLGDGSVLKVTYK